MTTSPWRGSTRRDTVVDWFVLASVVVLVLVPVVVMPHHPPRVKWTAGRSVREPNENGHDDLTWAELTILPTGADARCKGELAHLRSLPLRCLSSTRTYQAVLRTYTYINYEPQMESTTAQNMLLRLVQSLILTPYFNKKYLFKNSLCIYYETIFQDKSI
jgi:hypothetical protein